MLTAWQLPPYVGSSDPEQAAALEKKRQEAVRYLTERRIGEYGEPPRAPLAVVPPREHTDRANDDTEEQGNDERRIAP